MKTLRHFITVVVLCLALGAALAGCQGGGGAAPADVSGTWVLTDGEHGAGAPRQDWRMTLKQSGQTIVGTMKQYYQNGTDSSMIGQTSVPLAGTYANGTLKFTLANTADGMFGGSTWTATVSGNEMKGTHDWPKFPGDDQTFSAAKR